MNGFPLRKMLSVIFIALVLIYSQTVTAKPGKGGGGKPGGGDPDPIDGAACVDSISLFPSFAFTKLVVGGRKGSSVTGYEFYLSNAEGDCSVLVYSASAAFEDYSDLSYRQIGNYGVIAWRQYTDETVSGHKDDNTQNDLIKVVRFEINDQEMVTPLPLVADTVANSGNRYIGFGSVDLSQNGTKVLLKHTDAVTRAAEDVVVWTIREMDISNCTSDCTQEVIFTGSDIENIHEAVYGALDERVFFTAGYHRSAEHPLASQGYVAFIERQNGNWSSPRVLTIQGNGYYGDDFSSSSTFRHLDASLHDFGSGEATEAISHRFHDIETDQLEVHVIDVGVCDVVDTGDDCVRSGDSSIEYIIPNAQYSSFESRSGDTRLIFTSATTSDIFSLSLNTDIETFLTYGNEVDSAD